MGIDEKPRRDFIFLATGAFAAVGGIALTKPFSGHMSPAADSKTLPKLAIDLTQIHDGQQLKLLHDGRPVGIRHRTQTEIAAAQAGDTADLRYYETDQSRLKPKLDGTFDSRFIVVDLVCPRFGCTVIAKLGEFDGWYCPCTSAHYDTSGRIRRGPSPANLSVPNYRWTSDTSILLQKLTPFERYESTEL